MASSRVVLNHAAVGALLKSPEVERALQDRADRVMAAAEADDVQTSDGPMPYEVISAPSHDRARLYVVAAHPAGLAAEAKYGTLARALDAAG